MACDKETNTLELHIKVNGQNSSTISEKCNISTLRIPSDPSWPKIPPRRSSNNADDIIEPPCVITLTGASRKGRSVGQAVASRQLKARLIQRYEATTHISKRLPGCFDPRFRKQISRQNAEKPDESCITRNDEQTSELDSHITQGTRKLKDKLQETGESVESCMSQCHDVNNLLSSVPKSANKITDYPINGQSILETKHRPTSNSLQDMTNERHNVESRFSKEQKQENNRPLFLMIDEKRIHALPINALNTEAVSSSVQSLQCYSVQIPIVAYHDVPLQISSTHMQIEKVEVPSVCQNGNSVKDGEIVGNICIRSTSAIRSTRESRNEKYQLDNVERCNARKHNDDIYTSEKKSISKHCDGHDASDRMHDNENVMSNIVSFNQDITNEITLGKNRYGNFDALDNAGDVNNCKSYSNLNTAARLKNLADQSCAIDSCIANGRNERETSNGRKMAETWMHSCVNTQAQKLAYHVKDDRDNADKSSTNAKINNKVSDKSMQSLAFGKVDEHGKEDGKSDKEKGSKKERHGELRVNVKRKTAPTNLSRKAKSFFRRKSRLAITDSDCTLILPGYRYDIKGKRYGKICGRSKVSRSLHGRNGMTSTNSILMKYNASKQDRINCRSLMNLRVRNSFHREKPSSIPPETRELLNKSYWEYYWKLRRKITSAKLDNAKERDECLNKEHLPESQILRQCSVLSCMINTALRDSTRAAADGRPFSSDPAAKMMSNTRESQVYKISGSPSTFVKKIQRRKMKRASKRLLGFRAIALLCIAMYVAVIFLPMMYDYFFDEEYDDENANYIELTFQYVASSVGEALDGVIDVLTTILLRLTRFDRKR